MNRKKLGIAFGIGVLICGLGCGVAFAQYSGFSYAGERFIGENNIVTETIEKNIDSDSKLIIYPVVKYCEINQIADEEVPSDKIMFDVEYNSDVIDLKVDMAEHEKDEYLEEPETEFYFGDYTSSDGVKEMFVLKDELLKDLKDKKIGSYSVTGIKSITVKVNPINYERIEIY